METAKKEPWRINTSTIKEPIENKEIDHLMKSFAITPWSAFYTA